jgi:hypothetical protein
MFYPMLLLLHGQIFAFIPAFFLLVIAALLFAFFVKNKVAERKCFIGGVLSLIVIGCGILGLFFLLIFLDEFWYWIKYSF